MNCLVSRCISLGLGVLVAVSAFAQEPATAPATAPEMLSFVNNTVHLPIPEGWTQRRYTQEPPQAFLRSAENDASINVAITPTERKISSEMKLRLNESILKQIRDNVESSDKVEVLIAPRAERDDRFVVKIRDKVRGEKRTVTRLHMYREVGLNLVMVAVNSWADDPAVADAHLRQGEEMLLAAQLTRAGDEPRPPAPVGEEPTRPSSFGKGRVKLFYPAAWTEERSDQDEGLIAMYRDPADGTIAVLVSVRAIPKEVANDEKLRKFTAEQLARSEAQTLQFGDAKPVGKPEVIADERFVRKTRTRYSGSDGEFEVTSRQVLVGDSLLSIAAVAPVESAEQTSERADAMAAGAKPLGRRW